MRRCMLINLKALLTRHFLTICIDSPKHSMDSTKELYGLKQAPRAWYGRLSSFLIDNEFIRGKNDTTLFTKKRDGSLLVVQIYVDDIIFGSPNAALAEEFSSLIS